MTTRKLATDNYERTLTLPQGVEADEIVARYRHGFLKSWCRYSAKLAGRKIPIQIEQQANRKLEPRSRVNYARRFKPTLLRRIEILSANVLRLKHLELIARGP